MEVHLDAIDSMAQAARLTRPRLLLLLSVLSYLSDEPLTILSSPMSQTKQIAEASYPSTEVIVSECLIKGLDCSSDLKKLLAALASKNKGHKMLVASLLDRWRKASYLSHISQSDDSFCDEAIYSYFYVLDMIAVEHKKALYAEGEVMIKAFLDELLVDSLKMRGSYREHKQAEYFKTLRGYLLGESATALSKIAYSLDKMKLLDDKTHNFLSALVKVRNYITHGRIIYRDEMAHPLPPFFPLSQESSRLHLIAKTLSARAIAGFLELERWQKEWAAVHKRLHPSRTVIKRFISEREYDKLSPAAFLRGELSEVRPSSLVDAFLREGLKFKQLEQSLRLFLLNLNVTEENAPEVMIATIILADSKDKTLAQRCQEIVKKYHQYVFDDMKELLYKLEYLGTKPLWLRTWLETGDE